MNDSIRIPLGRSGTAEAWAIIDAEDYEYVALYRWYLDGSGYPFIAYAKDRRTTYLHNYVMRREDARDGMQVDHIDRDPLNARKSNLRVGTKVENMANTRVADRMVTQEIVFADTARRLHEAGCTHTQIAHGLGISKGAVSGYCRRD